jgi:hypothetical protein
MLLCLGWVGGQKFELGHGGSPWGADRKVCIRCFLGLNSFHPGLVPFQPIRHILSLGNLIATSRYYQAAIHRLMSSRFETDKRLWLWR